VGTYAIKFIDGNWNTLRERKMTIDENPTTSIYTRYRNNIDLAFVGCQVTIDVPDSTWDPGYYPEGHPEEAVQLSNLYPIATIRTEGNYVAFAQKGSEQLEVPFTVNSEVAQTVEITVPSAYSCTVYVGCTEGSNATITVRDPDSNETILDDFATDMGMWKYMATKSGSYHASYRNQDDTLIGVPFTLSESDDGGVQYVNID
jgi:hypothetical protein